MRYKTILLSIFSLIVIIIFSFYLFNQKNKNLDSKSIVSINFSPHKDSKNTEQDGVEIRFIDGEAKKKEDALLESILQKYKNAQPKVWAENPSGVINTMEDSKDSQGAIDSKNIDSKIQALNQAEDFNKTHGSSQIYDSKNLDSKTPQIKITPHKTPKILYLTLDACGGEYDSKLIDFLIQNDVHATLFISALWIASHKDDFLRLAKNRLFSIQNHGTNHKPLSINGKSIYGIHGTNSISEVFNEINENGKLIAELSGRKPTYFRSGTAYYDDVAVSIAKDMGYKIAGFSIVGDGGATYPLKKILRQTQGVKNGDILIFHFNKPRSDTKDALKILIPRWKKQGFKFGLLI